jgi:hypothetical protein
MSQAAKKREAKLGKKNAGTTAQDGGKGTIKCLAVDDGELYTSNGKYINSWCWEREPLVLAAAAKDNVLLRELLDAGAVVDAEGAVRARTALMHAAIGDNAVAAKALLAAGADFDAEDSMMKTPVDYASENSQEVPLLFIGAVCIWPVDLTGGHETGVESDRGRCRGSDEGLGYAAVQAAAGQCGFERLHLDVRRPGI